MTYSLLKFFALQQHPAEFDSFKIVKDKIGKLRIGGDISSKEKNFLCVFLLFYKLKEEFLDFF